MAKGKEAGLSKGLKGLFIIHGVIAIISGVLLYFVPYTWARLSDYGSIDPHAMRLLGAYLLALGLKDWFCIKARGWVEVRIILIQEIILTVLATLACLYTVLFAGAPAAMWMNVVLFGIMGVAWTYFYLKYRK